MAALIPQYTAVTHVREAAQVADDFVRALGFKLMAGVPEYRAHVMAAEKSGLTGSFSDVLYPVDTEQIFAQLLSRRSWKPWVMRRRRYQLMQMSATQLLPHVEALLDGDAYTALYRTAWFKNVSAQPGKYALLCQLERSFSEQVIVLGVLIWLCENLDQLPLRDGVFVSAGLQLRMADFFTHYRALMG